MRLVCPNCDAEYEVDDTLIPPEGRDVQCSNCSVTWFQKHADAEDTKEEASQTADETPQRPKTDPKALEIIHEEVERETRARQSESGSLETQADLGLQEKPAGQKPADVEPAVADANVAPAPRRAQPTKKELFPDIEEINSTLADAPDPVEEETPAEEAATEQRARSGFRIGFGLMLMLTAALLALYVYAPGLIDKFPAAEGVLSGYVSLIDRLRETLDFGAQGLLAIVTDLTERVGN
ncbi:MAG: zinc-ribbon domain-containing protein [Pseudomonadota bacterium]